MAVTELNKVLYVDQEFTTAVDSIKSFLDTNYPDEFNDYINSNMGQALIDIIAYAEQNLMWYMNRKITDLYFPTAVTPNAISKVARMLGYKVKGGTSAETELTVTLKKGPYTFPVTINTGFQFKGPNNTVWEYRGNVPIVYAPGQLTKTFVVGQGNTVVNTFKSNGTTNQFFDLRSVTTGKYVAADSVLVKVDSVEWTEYDVIPFQTINAYETNIIASPPFVKFGDSVQGNIPASGAGIQVSYVVTDGFKGRIAKGSITAPLVPLQSNFQSIPLTIVQNNPSVGGDDPEDLRSITVNSPLFQRTQDRAITKPDYDFLANQYINVAKADAQSIRSISGDTIANFYFERILDAVSGYDNGAYASIVALCDTVSGQVDQLMTAVSGQIVTAQTAIISAGSDITSDATAIDVRSSLLENTVSTIGDQKKANIDSLSLDITQAVSGCPLNVQTTVGSLLASITTNVIAMKTEVLAAAITSSSDIGFLTDEIRTRVDTITATITALNGNVIVAVEPIRAGIATTLGQIKAQALLDFGSVYQQVSSYVEAVSAHLDEHFTSGCDGNLVEVRVLGKDVNRKYVDPLQTTIDGLKAYLEARKEITQTVSVVSGIAKVVEANIKIQVKVSQNAIEDDVVNAIQDAIVKSDVTPFGILVEREFNKSLYVWEIHEAVRNNLDSLDQVVYLNIEIIGPTQYLDVKGNLIIPDGYVIQSGTLTIERLPRFT